MRANEKPVPLLTANKKERPCEDKMNEVMVQISSKDTFPTIFASAPATKNEMISVQFDLKNKENFLDIEYIEENTEYISNCSELAFFKCYATKIAESDEFRCPKKCIPFTFQSMITQRSLHVHSTLTPR